MASKRALFVVSKRTWLHQSLRDRKLVDLSHRGLLESRNSTACALAVPSSLKVSMQLWSVPMRCRFPRVFAKWPAGSGIAQTFSRRNRCSSRAFGTVGEV